MKYGLPEDLGAFFYRGCLNKQSQRVYDNIYRQLLRKEYSGVTRFKVPAMEDAEKTVQDSFLAYRALKQDHPEFFFLGNDMHYTSCGSEAKLEYTILYSPETIARIQRVLEYKLEEYVRGTDKVSLLKKEKIIYKRIVNTVRYEKHSDYREHCCVGPILFGEGVCEGQSALLILCLRRAGIPAVVVHGKSKRNRAHAWVICWMNGDPVHVDTTWESRRGLRYSYFNLSDRQISRDHFDFQNDNLPKCEEECWNDWRYF